MFLWIITSLVVASAPELSLAGAPPGADIVVVLDLSGSMRSADDKDGASSRFDAFSTWTHSFTLPGDRIGIVAMGNGSKLVAPLTPRDQFSFADYTEKLKHRARYTDVAAGLENAYYELKTNGRQNSAKLMLLLSDAQIDMPRGMWDLENSMRFLHDSLIPSLKKENIKLVSIVPDGLKANFPLLQELSTGTGGVYYRGLPDDVVAVRRQHIHPPDVNAHRQIQKQATVTAPREKSISNSSIDAGNRVKKTSTAPANASLKTSDKAEAGIDHSSPGSMRSEFVVLGAIILVGFALVMVAFVVLFRRTHVRPVDEDEIADVLEEVQALKSEAKQSERLAQQFENDTAFDDEPDFGEPREQLSVSRVSPFLDYREAKATLKNKPTDEIAVKPAFSDNHTVDPSFSVSNMETLIGTVSPISDDK